MARLFERPVTFIKSIGEVYHLPETGLHEVAFLGRSNVGKSTLINKLVNDKGLCKTSSTPGRTQMLNFFEIAKYAYLVDMPGYGYAKAPKNLVKKWQGLIPDYLMGRRQLKRLFLLIDSRHGLKAIDEEYMTFLDRFAVSYQVVLTKCDKVSANEQQKVLLSTAENIKQHGAAYPDIILSSAEKGDGLKDLRQAIQKAIEQS